MTNPTSKYLRTIICVLFLFAFTLSFYAQTVQIKLIETSDVHGAIMPYDLVNDTSTNTSLAQVHSYAEMERYLNGQQVVLLDNGDILQGDPLVYYYNYEDSSSINIYARAMNFMKYDAGTVGNHDVETGHKVYDKFRNEIKFPWLAANAVNTETGEPYFDPYFIIEKAGVKIAVLGLITPGIPQWLPKQIWEGMEFGDMIESADKWVKIIMEKEKPDLLIRLFHSGVDPTYGGISEDTYKNENAGRLVAEQVPGFDVVFVGHDHLRWNFKTIDSNGDSVLILGPLSRAKTIAVASITMSYDSLLQKWIKQSVTGESVDVANYRPDDQFMSAFMNELRVANRYVSKSLGAITKTISSKESIFGPSEFVDLIHTFQLETTGADVSFVSPLSFSSQIDSGWISVRDMFKLYRYENFLYTMELTGQEIVDYLEYSYNGWFNEMKSPEDHLLKFKTDEEGNIAFSEQSNSPRLANLYYNYSSAAGINYTVDVTKPAGERISVLSLSDRTEFEPSKKYTVAINSYRGNGGGGHLTRGAGIDKEQLIERVLSSTDKDLRYYMMKWIEKKKKISPKIIGNWQIIPVSYWQKGMDKDYEILFGKKNARK
jgi:2',3'-cyclic-nucleotide 2'-phosphodiesterase/3'-nucleotidase